MKKFRVNLTRTITMECSVVVPASNEDKAIEKVQARADAGKLGEPYVSFREYGKGIKEVEGLDGDEINEEIEVNDAYEEEDE